MINRQLITKDESLYIKGIAIILMFIHHLFVFPDRMPQTISIIYLYDGFYIEQFIGMLGKYCVTIFFFVSGYGFSISQKYEMKYYINKVFKVYVAFWLVFIIFIPLGYFAFNMPYSLDPRTFLANLFGWAVTYNGEWWFLFPYIVFVIITPLLQLGRKYILSIFIISAVLHNMVEEQEVLFWLSSYVLGFLCYFYNDVLIKFKRFIFIIPFALIVYYGFIYWRLDSMVFLVPFFICLITMLYKVSPNIIKKIIMSFGDKCLFMWLTHSFYCYQFAKDFIYAPKYSILILLNLLMVSYISAIILDYIYKWILKLCFRKAEELII